MVSGYNHNVKYKDLVFHVQTEDSGNPSPRVVSHIFIGGTLVATVKTPYSASLPQTDIKAYVTDLMQSQHKAMLKGLIHGAYDVSIARMRAFAQKLDGPAPLNVAAGQERSSFGRQTTTPLPQPLPQAPLGAIPAAAAGRPVDTDAARPDLHTHAPPPRVPLAPGPKGPIAAAPAAAPAAVAKANAIPIDEQGYAEAELIEADDQAVDSLFGNLIREKTLDEVISTFLKTDKPSK